MQKPSETPNNNLYSHPPPLTSVPVDQNKALGHFLYKNKMLQYWGLLLNIQPVKQRDDS